MMTELLPNHHRSAATSAPLPVALNRRFGFSVGGVLLLVAAGYYWRQQVLQPWLLAGGTLLGLLAGLAPQWLTPLRRLWEKLSYGLGRVNTYVLLLLAYGLVCVPLGVLLRLLGKDPLNQRWRPNAPSYWQPRGPKTSLHVQF